MKALESVVLRPSGGDLHVALTPKQRGDVSRSRRVPPVHLCHVLRSPRLDRLDGRPSLSRRDDTITPLLSGYLLHCAGCVHPLSKQDLAPQPTPSSLCLGYVLSGCIIGWPFLCIAAAPLALDAIRVCGILQFVRHATRSASHGPCRCHGMPTPSRDSLLVSSSSLFVSSSLCTRPSLITLHPPR